MLLPPAVRTPPFGIQVVSDTALIQSGVDNTQDPCLNVGLPVFTIHGNHDDPSGPEHFSAVDVLSSIHYVNYFGKHTFCRDEENDIGKIKMSPLLLIKVNSFHSHVLSGLFSAVLETVLEK